MRPAWLASIVLAVTAAACAIAIAVHAAPASPAAQSQGYSAAALYNAANADARAGKRGLAVLRYERARLLAPGDPDIDANLARVRRDAGVPAQPARVLDRLTARVDPNVLAWLGLVGLAAAGAGALAWRWYGTHRRLFALLSVAGLLSVSAAVCNALALWPLVHRAVVVAPSAPVRVSPVDIGDPLFTLSEAREVMLRGEHDGFLLIQTSDGKSGWAPAAAIAPIVPGWRP